MNNVIKWINEKVTLSVKENWSRKIKEYFINFLSLEDNFNIN